MTDELYIETDEAEDVAGSIRHALRCSNYVNEDSQAWKWGMLALHSAIQGACVCHLTTTACPIGAVIPRNKIELIDYFEKSQTDQSAKRPNTELMALPDLLKAVRKQGSCGSGSQDCQVMIRDSELEWFKRIHDEIRNQFVHFEPTGWTIEVSGIPKFGKVISRIILNIHKCGWAFRHLDGSKKDEMTLNLERLSEASWQV